MGNHVVKMAYIKAVGAGLKRQTMTVRTEAF